MPGSTSRGRTDMKFGIPILSRCVTSATREMPALSRTFLARLIVVAGETVLTTPFGEYFFCRVSRQWLSEFLTDAAKARSGAFADKHPAADGSDMTTSVSIWPRLKYFAERQPAIRSVAF